MDLDQACVKMILAWSSFEVQYKKDQSRWLLALNIAKYKHEKFSKDFYQILTEYSLHEAILAFKNDSHLPVFIVAQT